jgi:nucleotide-binding universal stress UspA family protein
MKKVLVPCDGSEPSVNALKKAAEMFVPAGDSATASRPEMILLYVVPPIEVSLPLDESGMLTAEPAHIQEMYSYLKDRAFKMLQQLADRHVNKDQFAVRLEVLLGSPAEEIIGFARGEKVDLIVMGNVGATGLSRLKALGSVSRSVSERAETPVMIVPYARK